MFISAAHGCKEPSKKPPKDPVEQPVSSFTMNFDADSAYHFVKKQVDFGPRVPGTMAHGITANYLLAKLRMYCDTAFIQTGVMEAFDHSQVNIKNIIGSINPAASSRILLCAHWDTRPQADEDKERPTEPADGANDGASGVGVLLEVARQLQTQNPEVGVDFIFFDAEDMGERLGGSSSWCLGSQFWSNNTHTANYTAKYGILLDMVGAKDAKFAFEGYSMKYAQAVVAKVWRNALALGHGNNFIPYKGGTVTDDHYFINTEAGIPTIDIIHYDVTSPNGFGDYWHTHDDNLDAVDKSTLKAVGETVLKTIWEEKP